MWVIGAVQKGTVCKKCSTAAEKVQRTGEHSIVLNGGVLSVKGRHLLLAYMSTNVANKEADVKCELPAKR